MHIYFDESGDTGFRFGEGSSRYFVVALVITKEPTELEELVGEQRIALGKASGEELKFARLHHEGRLQVLRALAASDLDARALVIDKHHLVAPDTRSRDGFYKYLVSTALIVDLSTVERALLVVDESFKSKAKQADLATYIRRELNVESAQKVKRIRDIAYRESHREPCLQVADLIAGAVARAYESKDPRYQEIIQKRITVVEMP